MPDENTALAEREPAEIATAPVRITIEQMILKAIEADKPELIDKFVAIFEKQETARKKEAFDAAYSQMQSDMPVVVERGRGQSGNYAKLEDIVEAVRPILTTHGFALSHRTEWPEKGVVLIVGILTHKDGYEKTSQFMAAADQSGNKNAIQAFGSTVSYGRRYTTKDLLNIVTRGEDNDGDSPQNGRKTKTVTQPREKPSARASDPVLPPEQRPQIDPVSESGQGIDKATAKGFTSALKRAFSSYGDQAATVAWDEFRKRFPKIEKLSEVPDSPEAKKLILNWIADPQRN